MRRLLEFVVCAVLGVIVAFTGAVAHRSIAPIGVILCVFLVLMAAVFTRAWASWLGLIAFAAPFVVLTFVFSRPGPGGSLLIAADGLGYAWLYGASAAIVIAAVLPVRLLGGGTHVTSA